MEHYKINKYINKFRISGDILHLTKLIKYKNQLGGSLNKNEKESIKKINDVIKDKCEEQKQLSYEDININNISNLVIDKVILSELIDNLLLKPKIRFSSIMRESLKVELETILRQNYKLKQKYGNKQDNIYIEKILIDYLKFIGFNVEYFNLYPIFSYFCNKNIDNTNKFLELRLSNIIDKMIIDLISSKTANLLKQHIIGELKNISGNICFNISNYSVPHDTYIENKGIYNEQQYKISKINKYKYIYSIIDKELINIYSILNHNKNIFIKSMIQTFISVFRDFNREQALIIQDYISKNEDLIAIYIDGVAEELNVGIETEREIYEQILNIDGRVNNMLHMNIDVIKGIIKNKNEFDIVIGKFDSKKHTYFIDTIIDIKHSAKLMIEDADKFARAIMNINQSNEVILKNPVDGETYHKDSKSNLIQKGYIYKVPFNHSTSVYILLNMMSEFIKEIKDNNVIMDIFNICTLDNILSNGNYILDISKYLKLDNNLLDRYNEFIINANDKLKKIVQEFKIYHCDTSTTIRKFQPYALYKEDTINILGRQISTPELDELRIKRLELLNEPPRNDFIAQLKEKEREKEELNINDNESIENIIQNELFDSL